MGTYNPLETFGTNGVPNTSNDTIGAAKADLLAGDVPALHDTDLTVLTGQTIPALTVVGLDGAGKVVPAVKGTVDAIGILSADIDTTAGDKVANVYVGGNFRSERLVWDASYATDADKMAAFRDGPRPGQIEIRVAKQLGQ